MVWQSIGTAPRDGAKLRLWLADYLCQIGPVAWSPPNDGWLAEDGTLTGKHAPTHWMAWREARPPDGPSRDELDERRGLARP